MGFVGGSRWFPRKGTVVINGFRGVPPKRGNHLILDVSGVDVIKIFTHRAHHQLPDWFQLMLELDQGQKLFPALI